MLAMERVPEDDLVGRLADTEARLDGLTGALPGIAFRRVMTPDGQISYPWFSNSLFDILGYAPDSMASGQNGCLNAVHWADRDAHRRAVLLSAETLTACPEEFRAVTSSGRVRWLKGGSRPRRAGDGSIVWDGVLIDVTGSREATFRLEMLMDHAADAIIVLDDNTAIDTVNGAASRLFDYRPGQLTGQPFSLLVPGADLGGGLVGGGPREMLACRRDGTTFPIELSTEAVRHESGRLFIAIGRDITERKSAERRLSFLAYFDPLTRLPNRTAFVDRVNGIGREGAAFGVLSLGIDRFGVINATLGHSAGDQVLIGLGDIVQAALRPGDLLARASGDRFLVLLDGGTSRIDLEEAVARVHTTAQAAINVAGEPLDVSVSVGAAFCPDDGTDADGLIRNADQALQRAKATGPGVLQVFNRDMRVTANRALALRTRLRRAVDRGEIIPYFQPQVDLTTGEVVGMEALARWIDPENGIIPPNDFIPIAEESGLIEGLCESILRNCARQNKAWQDQGLPVVPVAVNVSGRQFQVWRRLLASLESVLRETGLNPALMEIELTESSAMHDAETAIKVLRQIGEMGMACSIDDFGTGYSSLSVLKRFPVSKLKIDRSFVLDVLTDPNDAAIVGAIIAMARALGLTTIAEGVEDHAHATFLRGLGCQQMQGYLFARPLPADDMGRLLAEGRRLDLPA